MTDLTKIRVIHFWIFLTLTVIVGMFLLLMPGYIVENPPLYKDIETIRQIQHECLDRPSPHGFGLTQTNGGFFITCTPIKEDK